MSSILSRKRKYDDMIELNDNAPPWNNMPYLPMIEVYSYLSWKDRASASQVCKNWSRALGGACNWRDAKIYFTGKSHSLCFNSEMKFVTKFSHFLQDVWIHYDCNIADNDEAELALARFRAMCSVLAENAQLSSLALDNLGLYFKNTDADFKLAIIDCIVPLLSSQKKFQTLHFLRCDFNHKDLTRLFSALGKQNALSMIRNYEDDECDEDDDEDDEDNESDHEDANDEDADDWIADHWNAVDWIADHWNADDGEEVDEISDEDDYEYENHWFCNCLENLTTWDTNYSLSLEILISKFATHLREHHFEDGKEVRSALKHLKIRWTGRVADAWGILEDDWESFCAIFPNLKVDFHIFTSKNTYYPKYTMRLLLRKNIPLRKLTFVVDGSLRPRAEQLSPYVLLKHLEKCELHSNIETLRLENFVLRITPVSSIPLHWPNLEYLSIRISHPLNDLGIIFEAILKECPEKLKSIHVDINEESTSAEDEPVVKIVERFESKFLQKEVVFTINPAFIDDQMKF